MKEKWGREGIHLQDLMHQYGPAGVRTSLQKENMQKF
jgi:hypothetical protein